MTVTGWRSRAGTLFETEKRPATAARGMVVANHPLGAAAGAEMLAGAVDAADAALFALTVVEPMMVGIFGAGLTHLRLADGTHTVIDGYTVAPAAARADMYRPLSDTWPDYLRTEGDANTIGPLAVGVPGALKSWCEVLERFGTLDLATVLQPAIRYAERGFRTTAYLVEAISANATDLAHFPETALAFLAGGSPRRPGDPIVQPDYAATLRAIAAEGPDLLYGSALGDAITAWVQRGGGLLTLEDLRTYRTVEREPLRGQYRALEVTGAPPPMAGGLHVIETLNVLEGCAPAALGYGTPKAIHLLAEVMKIGFADGDAATGDPAFVDVPLVRLPSKEQAAGRRAAIGAHTTHVTTADAAGNVVAATQTINTLFGAKATAPGTGILLNNTMALFDPHPGHPNSIAPGKRATSSMAPRIVLQEGRPILALGLPGGVQIFTSVLQALVNLIDHSMSLQEAVEAPPVWSRGQELEIETGVPESGRAAVAARGHRVVSVPAVGGGMNAIGLGPDRILTGAACWRADGTPIGVGGGDARPGIHFQPDSGPRC